MIAPANFPVEPPPASSHLPHIANVAAEPSTRFTLDGDLALEEHLSLTCDRIADGIRGLIPARTLEGLLLGGGYGRGEGGVWRSASGDRPYNDLEFYVFLRGNRHLNERLHGRALHVLGEILTPQAGVEVEFRISSLPELAESEISMFSYDLVSGHRWLIGDDSLLEGCEPHANAEEIPLSEATRLLMNRSSGLLFAAERLRRNSFTAGDADFVARNIAKAQLAIGDAILTAFAQYHWSVRERQRRLERVLRGNLAEWFSEIARHHGAGVAFKLRPSRSTLSREELRQRHADVTTLARKAWLWIEGRRLGATLQEVRDYLEVVDKWPSSTPARNILVNLKVLGPTKLRMRTACQHPRHRVLNALATLLWRDDALTSSALLARLQSDLETPATTFPELVAAYRTLWSHVS